MKVFFKDSFIFIIALSFILSGNVALAAGTLWGWGDNSSGQIGLPIVTDDVPMPTQVAATNNWAKISASDTHTLIVKSDGTLWAIGNNDSGQLGIGIRAGYSDVPIQIGSDTNWSQVAAGDRFSLAIKTDGTLWSWGSNANAKTGQGVTSGYTLTPTQVGSDTHWSAIVAANQHALALKTDHTLWSWGNNANDRTGLNTAVGNTLTPTKVGVDTDWSAIATKNTHSLALKSDHTLWAWGSNSGGETGRGLTSGNTATPTKVGVDANWSAIVTGANHSLALKADGSLYSFGTNADGATCQGTVVGNTTSPIRVGSGTWSSIGAGSYFSVLLKTDGTLWSCGNNNNYRTGLNTNSGYTSSPTQVGSDADWNSITINPSFAIKNGGTVWFFGSNNDGQGGISVQVYKKVPVQVGSAENWSAIAAGDTHSIAIRSDGTLWSWGENRHGKTGQNTTNGSTVSPTQVGSDSNWAAVSGGEDFSLALKTDGTLWGFGTIDIYYPDDDTYLGDLLVPTQISADTNWAAISAGFDFALAVKTDGTLWGFGNNTNGAVGIEGIADHIYQVGSETNWSSVSAGGTFSLGLKTNHTLWGWGSNSHSQTGLNTYSNTLSPTQVGTDADWASVSAGNDHSLAIKTDHTLWSWGNNAVGETGQNTDVGDTLVPTKVGSDTNWSKVTGGWEHSLALKTDGTLWSWGNNITGASGLNYTLGSTLVPAQVGLANNWGKIEGGNYYSLALTGSASANVPSNANVVVDSSTQLTLTWQANSNSEGTEYYVVNTDTGDHSAWQTTLSWSSSGLTPGTLYHFTVMARNADHVNTDTASAQGTTAAVPVATSVAGAPVATTRSSSCRAHLETKSITITSSQIVPLSAQSFCWTSPVSLTWSVPKGQEGNVTADGIYHAPSRPGTYLVLVRDDRYSFLTATATINVVASPLSGQLPKTVIPSITHITHDLSLGVRQLEVKTLQQFLNTNGYAIAKKGAGSPGHETTVFGPATKAAVKKFQKANGIKPVNGVAGPRTRAKILELSKTI